MAGIRESDRASSCAPKMERFITPLVWIGGAISSVLILVLFALLVFSVVMRYFVARPVVWIDELTGYLLVASVMAGTAEAYRMRNHIAIDLVAGRLKGNARRIRGIWSDVCVITFATVLGISSLEAVSFARSFGSYAPGEIEIQTWIPYSPLLLASFLLGIFALARLIGRFQSSGSR